MAESLVNMIARWAAAPVSQHQRSTPAIIAAARELGLHSQDPIARLSGVGPRRVQQFERLGIRSIGDLVRLEPLRYEHRVPGEPGVVQAIVGTVHEIRRYRRRVTVNLRTPQGPLQVIWLHRPYLAAQLRTGDWLGLWGQKRFGAPPVMVEPEIAAGPARRPVPSLHYGRLVPVYPKTAGLSQRLIRELVAVAAAAALTWQDPLPDHVTPADILAWQQAITSIHFPRDIVDTEAGLRRLEFERALGRGLWTELRRHSRSNRTGIAHRRSPRWDQVLAALPFTLTRGQQQALQEICRDLEAARPMMRLLIGDVGSGKTAVAVGAAGWAALAGSQVAVLVPTELVARQHVQAFSVLQQVGVNVAVLTGGMSRPERKQLLADLKANYVQVVIGTHALLERDVVFDRLGLVIVDEQHRFGVGQRRQLTAKGEHPDQLALTATPIPRTLAMANLGHIDVSRISDRPPGQQPVATVISSRLTLAELHQWCEEEVRAGGRVFIVCPRLEKDDDRVPSAVGVYGRLEEAYGDRYGIGLVHGQMSPDQQRKIVEQFCEGRIPVLIATTVIEVGVDVPAATLMVILGADRFGLAALHQLRGRVGRGSARGRCLIVPMAGKGSARLDILGRTDRGTAIAVADLKLRGPGDTQGARQHGFLQSGISDPRLWRRAREVARRLVELDPKLDGDLRPLRTLLWPAPVRFSPRID